MQLSGGYSGSNVQLINGIVRKHSTYLSGCPDYDARRAFLEALSAVYPHMPNLRLLDDGFMEMDYIEGREGIADIDFHQYGRSVSALHALDLPAPPKDTGIDWLLDNALTNFRQGGRDDGEDLLRPFRNLADDAIVHGEITQVITDAAQKIYIIDWDECGRGSKYQDLGFVYYALKLEDRSRAYFEAFLDGYGRAAVDLAFIPKVAGLVAVAYAGFYDFEKRLKLGRELLSVA